MLMVSIKFLFVCLYYKLEFLPFGVRKPVCSFWLQPLLFIDHEQFNLSFGIQNKCKKSQSSILIRQMICVKLFCARACSVGKESTCNAGDTGDLGSVSGLGRSPGGGHGNPLQYSRPENPMDRGACGATVHVVTRVRQDLATKQQ